MLAIVSDTGRGDRVSIGRRATNCDAEAACPVSRDIGRRMTLLMSQQQVQTDEYLIAFGHIASVDLLGLMV